MNNETNNDVSKNRGKKLYNMAIKFFILTFICAVICIPSYISVNYIENSQIKTIVIFLYKGSFIIGIVFTIVWFTIYSIANTFYCPHCYTKGYKKEAINQQRIRSYKRRASGEEMRKVFNSAYDDNKTYPILVEDWITDYRHDCCGYEYTEKKQLYISDKGKEVWRNIKVIKHK